MKPKMLFLDSVLHLLADTDGPIKYAWEKKRAAVYEALKSRVKRRVRLLDVGCNTGAELIKYSQVLDGEFIGLDIECNFLAEHKNKANFLLADARRLPFRDETFEVVIATEVIEHFEQGEMFVKEVHRLLANGGIYILTTPNRLRFTALPRSLIVRAGGNRIVRGAIAEHVREYTAKELRSILERAGFCVESVTFLAFNPYLKIPKDIFIWLDKITDKIWGSFTKWDMLIVARKQRYY